MSKHSSPEARRRDQLDSLYWAGRAKQLGLTRQDAVKKAQLEAEALARVTARIVQGTANERPVVTLHDWISGHSLDALRYASMKFAKPSKPFPIKRPARYGKTANFLIVDDLSFDDLRVTLS